MRTYPCQKKTDFRPVFEHILNRQSRLEKPPCLGPSAASDRVHGPCPGQRPSGLLIGSVNTHHLSFSVYFLCTRDGLTVLGYDVACAKKWLKIYGGPDSRKSCNEKPPCLGPSV